MREYRLIRSKRRTLSLEIDRQSEIIVRAPFYVPKADIDRFVEGHEGWIVKKLALRRERPTVSADLPDEEIKRLKSKAKEILPSKVACFSEIMGLKPESVKITSAKKRFGSCSGKNRLCFSYLLMLYPDEAIDYVVVHELAHIKHHNHSKQFYGLVERYMPDYKQREKMLK